jgi:hypothetical protein
MPPHKEVFSINGKKYENYFTSGEKEKKIHPVVEEICYVNDQSSLSRFKVRAPYERYGAIAFFGKDRRLLCIYWCHGNRLVFDKDVDIWGHVKYVWRSSAISLVTIRDHLLGTHFRQSKFVSQAVQGNLSANHPMRLMILGKSIILLREICQNFWKIVHKFEEIHFPPLPWRLSSLP